MIHPDYKEYAEMLEPKLKHAQGNLLDLAEAGEFGIVVQGCNCFNTMGGGIAKEIRQRYPTVAAVDSLTERGDYKKLGNWTTAAAIPANGRGNFFTIINAYTQYNMSVGSDVFEYEAFALILKKLVHELPGNNFGFPYIGMGLAMGDPDRILPMLEEFAQTITKGGGSVTLVEFK
jgi:O-acetyl-ADP-ribose deacetylase (regulator of RNase III)